MFSVIPIEMSFLFTVALQYLQQKHCRRLLFIALTLFRD